MRCGAVLYCAVLCCTELRYVGRLSSSHYSLSMCEDERDYLVHSVCITILYIECVDIWSLPRCGSSVALCVAGCVLRVVALSFVR